MPSKHHEKISIVIPLYQKEKHIEGALSSVAVCCEHAGVDYEIVVVDDGSTDLSAAKVKAWQDAHPLHFGNLLLIQQPNAGAAAARNTGWKAASNEIIFFLDADDLWHPWHVEEVLGLVADFPDAVMFGDAWSEITPQGTRKDHAFGIGAEQRGYLPCFFEAMASGPMIAWSSSVATRKSALEVSGGFPEGVTHGEDKVGWGRLALLGPMAWSPRIGAVWDKTAENRSDGGQSIPSPAFRDFLRHAMHAENISDQMREAIRVCAAVEQDRMLGNISIYGQDTPEKYRKMIGHPDLADAVPTL